MNDDNAIDITSELEHRELEIRNQSSREIAIPDAPGDFVLELPEGYVLHLANAVPGTIIEVASWHGSGKPGEDTKRVMVGIGFDSSQAENANVSGLGGQIAATVSGDDVPVAKKSRPRWVKPVAWSLASVGLITGLWFSPLTLTHPTAGSSVGLGTTSQAIVIALPTDAISPGSKVVAYIDNQHRAVVLGRVNQVTQDAVLIQTDQGFAQSSRERVIGRVIVVVPYLGSLWR